MPYLVKAGAPVIDSSSSEVPDLDGVAVRWLVSAEHGESRHGMAAELTLAPYAAQPLHRHLGVDEAAIVLSGAATLLSASGEQPAPAGTLVLSTDGIWHGIKSGEQPVTLLTIYGGESRASALDTELAGDHPEGASPAAVGIPSLGRDRAHNPEMGFFNMSARFLVAEGALASSALFIGRADYGEPGHAGGHVLHSHPAAEEFLYLLEGEASHLTEHGELPMTAGDIALIPASEWHGIWNPNTTPAQALFGYLGASSRQAAGYELYPVPPAD